MPRYFQERTGTLFESDDEIEDLPGDLLKVERDDPAQASIYEPPPSIPLSRTGSNGGDNQMEFEYFSMQNHTIIKALYDLDHSPDLRLVTGTQPYTAYEPEPGLAP